MIRLMMITTASIIISSCLSTGSKETVHHPLAQYVTTCPSVIDQAFQKLRNYGPEDFRCGEIEVPLFHKDTQNLQKIKLQFMYLEPKKGIIRTPIVFTQGGPGGSSIELSIRSFPLWQDLIDEYGLIAYEYRGTDFTNYKLACTEKQTSEECIRYWDKKIDLRGLNSKEVAHDLEYIAQKANIEQYIFYGVSYGSLVGQYMMRYFPHRLRAVILDGVVAYGDLWSMDANPRAALEKLQQECLADNSCNYRYGPILGKYDEAEKTLQSNPQKYGDNAVKIMRDTIFKALYSEKMAREAYKLIANSTLITTLFSDKPIQKNNSKKDSENDVSEPSQEPMNGVLNSAAFLAIACSEAQIAKNIDIMDQETKAFKSNCKNLFPNGSSNLFKELGEVGKNVPTILLSGNFDPVTPYPYAVKVHKQLKNSQNFLVKGVGHGAFFQSGCARDLVKQYLKNPNNKLSDSCRLPLGM